MHSARIAVVSFYCFLLIDSGCSLWSENRVRWPLTITPVGRLSDGRQSGGLLRLCYVLAESKQPCDPYLDDYRANNVCHNYIVSLI